METDDLITPAEAARRLGMRRTSVYHLAVTKVLPAVKIAGRMFFCKSKVDALVAQGPRLPGRPRKSEGASDAGNDAP